MKKTITFLTALGLVWAVALTAQQVSFTSNTNLLNPVSGFGFEDCAVDMNGDYLDDVVRVGNSSMAIDYQQPDGSFTQTIFNVNFQNQPGWSICAGDIDGNGFNDLLFGSGDRVSFIYANEDGTAYTEDLHNEYIFSQRSTFADIDNDGHLDAFVCHDVDQSHPYRNDGNGNLVLDQSLIETMDMPGNYAALWVDYDNDCDIDLYVTKCKLGSTSGDPDRTNRLYRNNGDGTYSEVAEEANLADNAQSWATVFEDFDNDGDFDAFIVNHDFANRFMLNNGDGTFTDIIDSTGINPYDLGAWENAAADFNNDGFVDIFSELDNALYINNGDLTFTGQSLPFNDGAIADLNNDGFLDVLDGNGIWLNDGNDNNYVKVNTLGIFSNVNGIGARVEAYGEWGKQIREVRAGQSFSPMSSLCTHFGLGQATSIDSIVVHWTSGVVTVLENPAINATYDIVEANCLLDNSEITVMGETNICPDASVELVAPEGFTYQWSTGETTAAITVTEAGVYDAVLTNEEGCVSLTNKVVITVIEEEIPFITVNGEDIFCEGESVQLTASMGENYIWSNGMTGETIEINETGTYSVMADAICTEEQVTSEVVAITVLDTSDPEVTDMSLQSDNSVVITAEGENLAWYESLESTEPLGTGNTFQTPVLEEDATFYVDNTTIHGGELGEGGKPNFGGAGGLPSTGAYSYFDAYEPFTILSVLVSVPNQAEEGIRTIQLVDENEQVLEEQVFDLSNGSHVLELNFEVPAAGINYSLRCLENDLFRNSGGVEYPYPIADVGSVTTSFYGPQYYYYFYDWKIQKASVACVSDRLEVPVLAVGIDELDEVENISIFPNPATDLMQIQLTALQSKNLDLRLLDVTGKEILIQQNHNLSKGQNLLTLDITALPSGFYQLQLIIDDKMAVEKVVIEH